MELLAHSRWLTIDATSIPTSPLPPGIFSNTRNGVNTSRPGNHNGKQPVVVVLVLILLCHFGAFFDGPNKANWHSSSNICVSAGDITSSEPSSSTHPNLNCGISIHITRQVCFTVTNHYWLQIHKRNSPLGDSDLNICFVFNTGGRGQ